MNLEDLNNDELIELLAALQGMDDYLKGEDLKDEKAN